AVIVTPMGSADAVVSAWEKRDGFWEQVFDPMPAVVGRKGMAPLGKKREGDGRTPSGIFDLKTAFGYAPELDTKLNYRQATSADLWIDDPKSPEYNQWVKAPTPAASYELMKRADDLYKMGAVIEYNTNPVVSGYGSAIFLHVWKGPDHPTAGCVALDEDDVSDLLKWLDVQKSPVIVIETRWNIL
ncbi:MAG: L,D-transpeptidase family protein, partial [Candidatus Omnitrophica bacterium]|nr:L,D-transpeptidase family protein [Candidatus Omnitrophota bacterium]